MSGSRLNLFALPSQTSILFYLLVAVLWGAIGSNLFAERIIPLWPLGLFLFILPFYGFLLRPDVEKQKYNLAPPANGEYPFLLARIRELSAQVGLPRAPMLWLDHKRSQPIYSFGTFRRWYVVISPAQAQKLEDFLSNPSKSSLADVQIIHELSHFRNGDIWQLGFLVELFRYSFQLMGWAFVFLLGYGFLLILAKDAFLQFSLNDVITRLPADFRPLLEPLLLSIFPTPEDLAAVQEKARGIDLNLVLDFVAYITFAYVALAAYLWLFYRPLLWRVREYYADAGIFRIQKSVLPFHRFVLENNKIRKSVGDATGNSSAMPRWLQTKFDTVRKFIDGDFWPDFGLRYQALESPATVFYDWKTIAKILGGLVLALEVFLATPVTLSLYGKNPLVLPVIGVTIGMIYFLLPHIILGKKVFLDGLKILGIVALIRASGLFLTLGLLWSLYFLAPDLLFQVLQSAIYTTAGYAGLESLELSLFEFLVEASGRNILQIPIVLLVQTSGFALILFIFRKMLTWYGYLTNPKRFQTIAFLNIVGISLALSIFALPAGMSLLHQKMPELAWIAIGLLLIFILLAWFYLLNRRYACVCPNCGEVIPAYQFSVNCEQCASPAFAWLVQDEK